METGVFQPQSRGAERCQPRRHAEFRANVSSQRGSRDLSFGVALDGHKRTGMRYRVKPTGRQVRADRSGSSILPLRPSTCFALTSRTKFDTEFESR